MNQKLPIDRFAIFEMNKVYRKEDGLDDEKVPVERVSIGFVVAERKNKEIAYYKAKKYVAKLLGELNVAPEFLPIKNDFAEMKPFESKRSAEIWVNGDYLGVVGEFKNSVRNEFKLAPYLAGFEIDLNKVVEHMSKARSIDLTEKEKRDLTIATSESYGELVERIRVVLAQNDAEAEIIPIGIYQPEKTDKKNISVHLEFTKYNDEIMQKLEKL